MTTKVWFALAIFLAIAQAAFGLKDDVSHGNEAIGGETSAAVSTP